MKGPVIPHAPASSVTLVIEKVVLVDSAAGEHDHKPHPPVLAKKGVQRDARAE
jgi:hypothetical protein